MKAAAVVICGPTASGKSSLALDLAGYHDIEIISADSAQVYRGMDIGTAKPDAATLARIPHHLIDIREPSDPYSAADFRQDAIACVREIHDRGRLPVIAGGTMLYLKALKQGIAELPAADEALREEISREASEHGWQKLHGELEAVDPEAATRIRPVDTQRLQRAIEVYRITGIPLSELHRQSTDACPFPLLEIGIFPPDRASLHKVIEARFLAMLDAGLVDEVRRLKSNPALHPGLPSIKAVGYRQIWSYLCGEIDEASMIRSAVAATRQLAKRQYTWLRSWKDLARLDAPDTTQVLKIMENSTIFRKSPG